MKQKKWIFGSIAASVCIISAGILIGMMGIYAEDSGTMEWTPETTQTETADMLTQALQESSKEKEDAQQLEQELKLHEIWNTLYSAYLETDMAKQDEIDLPDIGLTAEEAGLIFLKEIQRIYPNDSLDGLYLTTCQKNAETGYNGENYLEWDMYLINTQDPFLADENEISYSFTVDAISGKIILFQKFRPFQKDREYACSSWTDEEIIENVRQIIETFQLADPDSLDWSDVEVFNGTDEYASSLKELEEDPESSFQISSFVFFSENGQRQFHVGIDWMTGELSSYFWLGTSIGSPRP